MIVNRTDDQEGPATLTLYFRDDGAPPAKGDLTQPSSTLDGTSKAPEPGPGERTVVMEVKGLHSDVILKEFMSQTNAVNVNLTPQEEIELEDLKELRRRGEVDRKITKKENEAIRREKARLALAMSEAAAVKAAA